MSGCTLLMSSAYPPFVQFFNYTPNILEIPAYQYFNASIRAQQYASGGVLPYQRAFHAVLFIVLQTSALCARVLAERFAQAVLTDLQFVGHFVGSDGEGVELAFLALVGFGRSRRR